MADLTYIGIWFTALLGDGLIFTFGYTVVFRVLTHHWWWQKQIEKKYQIQYDPDGTVFKLQGNPITAIRELWSSLTEDSEDIYDYTRREVKKYEKAYIRNKLIKSKEMDAIDDALDAKFNKMLSEMIENKKDDDKKVKSK